MATDIFAKIGTIKGESTDAKHKDEIEVLSWSWGVPRLDRCPTAEEAAPARRASTTSTSPITSTRRRRR